MNIHRSVYLAICISLYIHLVTDLYRQYKYLQYNCLTHHAMASEWSLQSAYSISIYLSIYLSKYAHTYIYLYIHLSSIYWSIDISIYRYLNLFISFSPISIYIHLYMYMYMYICLSISIYLYYTCDISISRTMRWYPTRASRARILRAPPAPTPAIRQRACK